MNIRIYRYVIIGFMTSMLVVGCGSNVSNNVGNSVDSFKENKLLQYFKTNNPGLEVIKCDEADLNNDNRNDLIVIYKINANQNGMRVVLDLPGNSVITNEVPAPYSNQVILFKNIDNKPPMEFIVQGSKANKIGYAIFRVEENEVTDLFGEGMEGCCS